MRRMGRGNVFVLVFVAGLIAASLVVINSVSTKLGLDLKGGVELIYQGTPTNQVESVSGADIERSIEIIRERIDQFGVAEPEVARLGEDGISVSLPDVTNAQRAIDQVGTTAQLQFYDWEPNLIGREKVIGGRPGSEPPQTVVTEASEEWQDAGRTTTRFEDQQLIFSGAFPTAYAAVKLASEQKPEPGCTDCSTSRTRYYLFNEGKQHGLIAGPEFTKEDLYLKPTGGERPHKGLVLEVPPGTVVVSELPSDRRGQVIEDGEPGWYALRDRPALSGTDITNPKQESAEGQLAVTFDFTDDGQQAFQEVTRRIAQRGAASAIGPSQRSDR